ncbi:DUF397 domain-containing protein [Streptomyces albiaxialis]
MEVARAAGRILVRDSKDTTYPYLTVSPDAWDRFVRGAGRGA